MDRNGEAEVDNGIVKPPLSQDIVFEIDVVESTGNDEINFQAVDSDDVVVVESAGSEDVVFVEQTVSEDVLVIEPTGSERRYVPIESVAKDVFVYRVEGGVEVEQARCDDIVFEVFVNEPTMKDVYFFKLNDEVKAGSDDIVFELEGSGDVVVLDVDESDGFEFPPKIVGDQSTAHTVQVFQIVEDESVKPNIQVFKTLIFVIFILLSCRGIFHLSRRT
jgi:hypothetical protein